MAEVISEQWVEPEEVLEPAGLLARRPRTTSATTVHDLTTTKSVYLDNDESEKEEWTISGANPGALHDLDVKLVDADIGKVLNAFINAQDDEIKTHEPSSSTGERGHEEIEPTEEYDEEEVIELEFERAIKKLDTHTMHCPRCNTQVTKVILRRKRVVVPKQHKPLNLLGCFSCLSVFIPSGNCFNMFRIFGNEAKKPAQTVTQATDDTISPSKESTPPVVRPSDTGDVVIQEKGGCLGLFWIFRNKKDKESVERPQQKPAVVDTTHDAPLDSTHVKDTKVTEQDDARAGKGQEEQHSKGENAAGAADSISVIPYMILHGKAYDYQPAPLGVIKPGDVRLDIPDDLDTKLLPKPAREIVEQQIPAAGSQEEYRGSRDGGSLLGQHTSPGEEPTTLPINDQGSKSIEIVKSIVYGGLMESITSLSIVASAASSGATTLNIIALGLANLIGGLSIIAHNLWDLKDERINPVAKYQEVLGQRANFPLHATFAILSFLIFGLVSPVTYGFAFHASDDRDYKILAVAAASLLCVIMLAIGKSYVQRAHEFSSYIKTIMYYVTIAFGASGVSYAAGHLVEKLMEDLGLFDTIASSPPALTLPGMNPIFASF